MFKFVHKYWVLATFAIGMRIMVDAQALTDLNDNRKQIFFHPDRCYNKLKVILWRVGARSLSFLVGDLFQMTGKRPKWNIGYFWLSWNTFEIKIQISNRYAKMIILYFTFNCQVFRQEKAN